MDKRYLFYAMVPIMEKGYNLQEIRILGKVFKKKTNISEISKELGIDYKNTHRYINRLYKDELITLEPAKPVQGKKVYVALSEKALQEILDELEAITLRADHHKEIGNLINESRRKLKYTQLLDKHQEDTKSIREGSILSQTD